MKFCLFTSLLIEVFSAANQTYESALRFQCSILYNIIGVPLWKLKWDILYNYRKNGAFYLSRREISIISWAQRGSVALWTIDKYIICLSSRWLYKDRDFTWAQNPGFYFLNIVLNISRMSCWEKTCVENSDWYYRLSIGMNQDSNKTKGKNLKT